MRKFVWIGVLLAAVVLLPPAQAEALDIKPPSDPTSCILSGVCVASGSETSQSDIDKLIAGILGDADMLYKQNVNGPEEGQLAPSYQTTFSNTASKPEDATITYLNNGQYVGSQLYQSYLLVKDGHNSPAWYLFDLTKLGWDGKEELALQDFWAGKGAISHVTLYGTAVPEPATLSLLAAGLLAMSVVRRRRSQVV